MKLNTIINPAADTWSDYCQRPQIDLTDLNAVCSEVFAQVQKEGDKALKEYTRKFDGAVLDSLLVSDQEIEEAIKLVDSELKDAILIAKDNITKFHAAQKHSPVETRPMDGVVCRQEARPIEKVGLYIPGGTAPLFSTVLMLAVPAKIAECREIVMCTPPNKEGKVNPAILYAARLCGVTTIVKLGGVQAIAAMSIGSESVPSVYKILGPGNQYVMAAKLMALTKGVAIDMPAGPSEVLVIADETANASFVAADLLSQAEHGADSQVMLVTTEARIVEEVEKELNKLLERIARKDFALKALANSKAVVLDNIADCIRFSNVYAPEHLILSVKNYSQWTSKIINAGSVFLGNYTPESAGDYASGTNHTLPTNGYARAYSGVNLDTYMKKITFQEITQQGISILGHTIETMAKNELLEAHALASKIRRDSLL